MLEGDDLSHKSVSHYRISKNALYLIDCNKVYVTRTTKNAVSLFLWIYQFPILKMNVETNNKLLKFQGYNNNNNYNYNYNNNNKGRV